MGCTLVQGAPQDFLARPIRWLEWIDRYGGSGTAGPNFSYAARRTGHASYRQGTWTCHNMRVWLNGAEPVDPDTFRKFFETGAKFGLKPEGAFPAFGMAEVCIAGCFPTPGVGTQAPTGSTRRALENDRLADRGR
ncbi:MAG: hypothetical protein V9F03_12650 [Microthrixaceae bacterium]